MAAEGSPPLRMLAFSIYWLSDETIMVALQLAPPSVERNEEMLAVVDVGSPIMGTMTVPSGCATGWPPMPLASLAVCFATPQLNPPSLEVLIEIWLNNVLLTKVSHSV